MIVLLAAAAFSVSEIVNPEADEINVSVAISIPAEMDDVRGALQAAVRLLPDGSALHSRSMLADLTRGRGIEAWVMPTYVGFRYAVDPDATVDAVTIAFGLMHSPKLEARLDNEFSSNWYAPLWQKVNQRPPTEREIREAWAYLRKHGRAQMVMDGPIAKGTGQRAWDRLAQAEVDVKRIVDRPRPDSVPLANSANALWLDGLPVAIPNLPVAALATCLLGQGKSGELFRVAREELGISYRQEAFLWPDAAGWRPRIYLTSATPITAAMTEQLRERLIARSSAWTEDDLARAKGMLGANLTDVGVWSPFVIAPWGSTLNRADDRASMTAYWKLMGQDYKPADLNAQTQNVGLDAVKMAARTWLTGTWTIKP